MPRLAPVAASGLLIALAGCTLDWERIAQQGHDLPSLTTGSTSSTGVEGTTMSGDASTIDASTTASPGATTSTATSSDSASEGMSGTTDDGSEAVPLEVAVFLSPPFVGEVGEVQVSVWTSRLVDTIDVFDGDAPLVLDASPEAPVCVFEVTSENKPGDGTRTIRAVAHAADGVSAKAEKDLAVDVAPGGTDVWSPYVQAGPINGFTGAALLGDGAIAAAGFFETQQGLEAVAVKIDGATGTLQAGPIALGKVALASAGHGPAIAAGEDGAVFVASTRPGPTWAVSRLRLGEPLPIEWTVTGAAKTKAIAVAVAGPMVIVVGGVEFSPGTHDLRVWWLAAEDGALLHEAPFAMPKVDDPQNKRDELGRGVALVGDDIVVVGEREIFGGLNQTYRRTIVLRYSLAGAQRGEWTSPGELLEEDGGMGVAPLHNGGFVVTGWGRDKGTIRQVMTRWFSATGKVGPMRVEPTPGKDALGYAIAEDREGKIIIASARKQLGTDMDAWIFAVRDPVGAYAWEVVRDGPGHGPDDAAGLAVGPWGHVSVAGSEFAELQPRAFVLRLYP